MYTSPHPICPSLSLSVYGKNSKGSIAVLFYDLWRPSRMFSNSFSRWLGATTLYLCSLNSINSVYMFGPVGSITSILISRLSLTKCLHALMSVLGCLRKSMALSACLPWFEYQVRPPRFRAAVTQVGQHLYRRGECLKYRACQVSKGELRACFCYMLSAYWYGIAWR